jgi:ABC-type dipeptide/oligopeptide/nickel transport system permease subunit
VTLGESLEKQSVTSNLTNYDPGIQHEPPPYIPSWGNMLGEARAYLRDAPWTMLFPGLSLTVTVLALNVLGDGIRDVLDPRLCKG